jgi:hypothetical protein
LAEIQGSDFHRLTASERGKLNKALRELRSVEPDLSADLIRSKAKTYAKEHPDWVLTCAALAGHWSELEAKPERTQSASAYSEPDDWKRWLDTKRADSPLATGGEREAKAWAQIERASQETILVGMKEEPLED